ncbi:MAG: glycoside hydrolase family 3 N-terminal domain-containing protein [Termitinemataceae bacterium]
MNTPRPVVFLQPLFLILSFSTIFLLIVACSSGSRAAETTGRPTRTDLKTSVYMNPALSIPDRVADLLKRMSLEEKIGQMTQADSSYLKQPEDITRYGLGSILSGGNSYPYNNRSFISAADWKSYIEQLQKKALATRLGIPLLYGVDAVHGNQKVLGATIVPHNIGIGATGNEQLAEQIAEITALECKAVGINWTFAPAVSVARDERWGRTYESFSEDPVMVSRLGAAMVRGFQKAGVAACSKHYLGDGGTTFGTGHDGLIDQGDTKVPNETVHRELYLSPYRAAGTERGPRGRDARVPRGRRGRDARVPRGG